MSLGAWWRYLWATPAPVNAAPVPLPDAPGRVSEPATFSPEETARLVGVHPDLIRVITRARNEGAEFRVLEGVRTSARQKELFAKGATKTLNSRHLTGHAVDLGATVNGSVRWDWPLYHALAVRVKTAAKAEKVAITWGGDWASFPDGPHWELPRLTQNAHPG